MFLLMASASQGQCSMCRANAKSSLQNGSDAALGLNAGIEYLLLMPYIAAVVVGVIFYINHRKKQASNV